MDEHLFIDTNSIVEAKGQVTRETALAVMKSFVEDKPATLLNHKVLLTEVAFSKVTSSVRLQARVKGYPISEGISHE